jgi:hypothetical protein
MRRSDRSTYHAAHRAATLLALAMTVVATSVATGQVVPARGRFSLYGSWSQRDSRDGSTSDLTEVIASVSLQPDSGSESLLDYSLDLRVAEYPGSEREQRISIYEAFVGLHSRDDRWSARVGQLWVRELGGLGSIGGLHGEYRLPTVTALGSFRVGLVAGLEPERYDTGFVEDIRKAGVYAALDGSHGRRHVLGYVTIRNTDLTERSVVVFNNSIPVADKVNVYQTLEYDTKGPGGLGGTELTYFFANVRYSPARLVDIQGTYHRGRSIDARSITQDQLDGRPVSPESLEGLLFESARLRITVRPTRRLSLWASAGQDQNNHGDDTRDRLQAGVSARRVFGTPVDVTMSMSRTETGLDSYDSLSASIGTTLGSRAYLSLDYHQAVAIYHRADGQGGTIEIRPDSNRYSLSCNLNLSRTLSLLMVAEALDSSDDDELRMLAGLVVRF